jgi:uncharacterized membrane protein YdcZ (DUF606 family)
MTNFRTALIGLAAVAAMLGTQALAADVSLAPGKPAGTKEAQRRGSPNLLLIGGAAAVAIVAVVIAVQQDDGAACSTACTAPTTTTTT